MSYGKNVTNTEEVLTLSASQINPPRNLRATFGDTGYMPFAWTPRREFGLTVRSSFGSR